MPTTLRARLILLVAALCGAAVAIGGVAAYTITRAELRRQVDASLRQQPSRNLPPDVLCGEGFPPSAATRIVIRIQRLSADGTVCNPDGSSPLPVSRGDLAIAQRGSGDGLRDATTDGVHLRIRTIGLDSGYAIQVARPLTETDAALRRLGKLLLLTTLLALAGVGLASLLLARRVLEPIKALTGAAEHIAQTEDLDVPINVDGRDEVARLAAAFNRMTSALASSRRRQRHLVADAGHELRTPLTSLRTNIDLLQRAHGTSRPLSPEQTATLYRDIGAQTNELTHLVNELVELARDEQPDLDAAPVALDEIVARAVERARPRAGSRHLRLTDLGRVQVHGTSSKIETAIVNLLDNALKFSPDGSLVHVTMSRSADAVHVIVADQGPGMNPDDLPRAFDRFWRSDTSRGLPGSGLGLAIAQQTATAHGGNVRLDRNESGGTTATLSLPVFPGKESEPRPARGL